MPSGKKRTPAKIADLIGGRGERQLAPAAQAKEASPCSLLQPDSPTSRQQAEQRYDKLFEHAPLGFLTLDREGCTCAINRVAAAVLVRESGAMIGKPFAAWLPDEQRSSFLAFLGDAFRDGKAPGIELRIRTPLGDPRDVLIEAIAVDETTAGCACSMAIRDLSERDQAQDAASLTARVIESAAEGMIITDANGIIQSVNPAFETSTGYSAAEAIGRTPALLQSGRHGEDFYREMWRGLAGTGRWQGEIWNRHKSGEIYPEWLSISAVTNSHKAVTHYVGIFSDAHTQEFILERLHQLAYYDGLTGLPNRRLFVDRLNLAISHARRNRHTLAVMFIDLDHFKHINDSRGHKAGDALLVAVTDRMKTCMRAGDTLARMGGDEFTAILPDLSHPEAALQVAKKLLDCYTRPLQTDGQDVDLSASIGISVFPDDAEHADDLLALADAAMYRVKASGRNGCLRHGEEPATD